MSRSDAVYVTDILESVNLILQYVGEQNEFEFTSNIMLQDAVIRRFEIIGEASSQISDAFKVGHPQMQWKLMKAMRNKLIHEYFGVSAQTLIIPFKLICPNYRSSLLS